MLSSIQNSSGVAPCRRKMAATPCFFLSRVKCSFPLFFSLPIKLWTKFASWHLSYDSGVPNRSHPTDSFYPVNPWIWSFQTENWFLWGQKPKETFETSPKCQVPTSKCKKKKNSGDRWRPQNKFCSTAYLLSDYLETCSKFLGTRRKVFVRKILLKQ